MVLDNYLYESIKIKKINPHILKHGVSWLLPDRSKLKLLIYVEGSIINGSSLILCGLLINKSYPETLNQIFDIY